MPKNKLGELISLRFRTSKWATVKSWKDDTKCPLSLETMTAVIYRGKVPAIPAFIAMSYTLGLSTEEIADECKRAGDTIFWKTMSPPELTNIERQVLYKFKELGPPKRAEILEMLGIKGR